MARKIDKLIGSTSDRYEKSWIDSQKELTDNWFNKRKKERKSVCERQKKRERDAFLVDFWK